MNGKKDADVEKKAKGKLKNAAEESSQQEEKTGANEAETKYWRR